MVITACSIKPEPNYVSMSLSGSISDFSSLLNSYHVVLVLHMLITLSTVLSYEGLFQVDSLDAFYYFTNDTSTVQVNTCVQNKVARRCKEAIERNDLEITMFVIEGIFGAEENFGKFPIRKFWQVKFLQIPVCLLSLLIS